MASAGGRRVAWAGTRRKPVLGGSKCAIHGALRSRPRLPGTLQPNVRSGRLEELASAGCGGRYPGRHAPGPGPGRSTPCVDALAFRTAPAAYGLALPRCRRADDGEQVVSCQVGPSQAKRSQAKPRPPCLGSNPAHQPCVYGMAWVGWRDRNAPWMAHFEPPWTGSRRVPRPHPRRPATHQSEMRLLLWLWLWLWLSLWLRLHGHGHGHGQHQPPQPAEHPPRYTQAIASPPGPLKPCNINGLKGKSAP
ncbi:hypothetical protein EDF74_1724 [Stenotrophomonas rhizophila]|nr:hypothetical protein EDF74_1724 [Stenotrophomonas rhizophila]